jgi:hypothetical protein
MKRLIFVAVALLGVAAIGAYPRYIEELRTGGGYGDAADGGADFLKDGSILTDGPVGIGTDIPGGALDVAGAVQVSGNLTVDTDTLHVDSANNRVGLGKKTPDYLLHVYDGDLAVEDSGFGKVLLKLTGTREVKLRTSASSDYTLKLDNESAGDMHLNVLGNIDLSGDLTVDGGDLTTTSVDLTINPGGGDTNITGDLDVSGDGAIDGIPLFGDTSAVSATSNIVTFTSGFHVLTGGETIFTFTAGADGEVVRVIGPSSGTTTLVDEGDIPDGDNIECDDGDVDLQLSEGDVATFVCKGSTWYLCAWVNGG